MSVTFRVPYQNYPAGTTATFTSEMEASLITQGIAVAATAESGYQSLVSTSPVTWNVLASPIADITLTGNITMNAPTNQKRDVYILHVIQDGVGSRTITWNSAFKWSGGTAPTLSIAAGARDIFSFISDGTNMYGAVSSDVR